MQNSRGSSGSRRRRPEGGDRPAAPTSTDGPPRRQAPPAAQRARRARSAGAPQAARSAGSTRTAGAPQAARAAQRARPRSAARSGGGRRSGRGQVLALAAVVFVLALVAGGLVAWMTGGEGSAAAPADGELVTVEIPEGAGATTVGAILADAGVIESRWTFRIAAAFDGRGGQIRPGAHDLEAGASVPSLLDTLTSEPPPPDTFVVTVPEGLQVEEALARIAEAEGSPFDTATLEEALLEVPVPDWVPVEDLPEGAQIYEGLLFPATYEFFLDVEPEQVLAEMVNAMSDTLNAVGTTDTLTPYETLIVASMIEREVRLPEERALVSSVIANRLDIGMRLQIDATVQYAQGEHRGVLLFEDLRIDSAWNTYEADGLPPTPIAAPGQAALAAAAEPDNTDFLFYVVCDTETGEHAFAETDVGHADNVARYREIQDSGGRVCPE